MFVSFTVFMLSGRGLCDGPIPRPGDSYRLWCVCGCDQVKIKTLYTCCEQVGRRRKDYETKFRSSSSVNCRQITVYWAVCGVFIIVLTVGLWSAVSDIHVRYVREIWKGLPYCNC
jgi:hypothetical protein